MTELKVIECDRCGKEFKIPAGQEPYKIGKWEYGKYGEEEPEIYDLCEDCWASLFYWLNHWKQFDKLADKIAREETGDE